MVRMPPDPPEEERGARLVSPVQFLEQPPAQVVPEGIVHPSQNISHSFTMEQEVEDVEPSEADLEPLLVDQTVVAATSDLKVNPDDS